MRKYFRNLRRITLLFILWVQLKYLPKKNWKFGCYGISEGSGPACKTSGCALGWAAMNPLFNSLGLQSGWIGSGIYKSLDIGFKGNWNCTFERAGAKLFDISKAESEWLFFNNYGHQCFSDVTVQEVRDRIMKLIKHYNLNSRETNYNERE